VSKGAVDTPDNVL